MDLSFDADAYLQPEMRKKTALPNISPERLEQLELTNQPSNQAYAVVPEEFSRCLDEADTIQSVGPSGVKCRITKLEIPSGIWDDMSSSDGEDFEA